MFTPNGVPLWSERRDFNPLFKPMGREIPDDELVIVRPVPERERGRRPVPGVDYPLATEV